MAIDLRTGEAVCKTALADRRKVSRAWHEIGDDMFMFSRVPTSRRAEKVRRLRADWSRHISYRRARSAASFAPVDSWVWTGVRWEPTRLDVFGIRRVV